MMWWARDDEARPVLHTTIDLTLAQAATHHPVGPQKTRAGSDGGPSTRDAYCERLVLSDPQIGSPWSRNQAANSASSISHAASRVTVCTTPTSGAVNCNPFSAMKT